MCVFYTLIEEKNSFSWYGCVNQDIIYVGTSYWYPKGHIWNILEDNDV